MKNEKIVLISFVAMICVVMQHCCCGSTIEDWFVPMFTTWAVPWFFVVSGYFFYGTVTKKKVVAILTSKVRTLLIPYVIWCVFGAVLFCECTNSDVWGGCDLFSTFAISRTITLPIANRALWYVRALMIFVVLGICAFFLVRKCRKLFGVAFAAAFLAMGFCVNHYLFVITSTSKFFYFIFGFLVADLHARERFVPKWSQSVCVCFVVAMGFVCLKALWFWHGYRNSLNGGMLLANISYCLAIMVLWIGSTIILDGKHLMTKSWLSSTLSTSAIVYFSHYPILYWYKKMCVELVGELNLAFVVVCVTFPVAMVLSAVVLRQTAPKVYNIVSGGR